MAINNSLYPSGAYYSNKYDQGLGLEDFFFRGTIRNEKANLLKKKEKIALFEREQLQKCLRNYVKNNFQFKSLPLLNQPKQTSSQRWFSWINGTNRTSQIRDKRNLARMLNSESKFLDIALATISSQCTRYKKASQDMQEAAQDADDYDSVTKCSWTWWR